VVTYIIPFHDDNEFCLTKKKKKKEEERGLYSYNSWRACLPSTWPHQEQQTFCSITETSPVFASSPVSIHLDPLSMQR
jgi:hypothetical protein